MTEADYQKLENKEKTLDEINNEINSNKLKELIEITEPNHVGAKFRRFFEDMKIKLSLDAKIKKEFFPETENNNEENKEMITEKKLS